VIRHPRPEVRLPPQPDSRAGGRPASSFTFPISDSQPPPVNQHGNGKARASLFGHAVSSAHSQLTSGSPPRQFLRPSPEFEGPDLLTWGISLFHANRIQRRTSRLLETL